MIDNLAFAFAVQPGALEWQALMLANSIRTFGGPLAGSPIWVLVPDMGEDPPLAASLAERTRAGLSALGAELLPFPLDPTLLDFPFAAKVVASGLAEKLAQDRVHRLLWMDVDSLVIGGLEALDLEEGRLFGYRPVDHTLIGSRFDQLPDPFWQLIYRKCDVPEGHIFPMMTSVDRQLLRPYFNAGFLLVRPQAGLLQSWRKRFLGLYNSADLIPFYEENALFRIFVHQALLTGTILSKLDRSQMVELSYLVNYPLHMHAQYPAGRRVASMNELITGRYDLFFQDADWPKRLPVLEPLKSWLDEYIV